MRMIHLDCSDTPALGGKYDTQISLRIGGVAVDIAHGMVLIHCRDNESFTVPVAMLIDPNKSTEDLSVQAKTKFFSKFTTLVRSEINPSTGGRLEQRLQVPKHIFNYIRDVVKMYDPGVLPSADLKDVAQRTADLFIRTMHSPGSTVRDSHGEDSSQWAVKHGDIHAFAQLQPKTNQLRFSMVRGDEYEGRIGGDEFIRWMEAKPTYAFNINSAHKAEADSPLEYLYEALRAKRIIAMRPPLTRDHGSME